MKPHHLGTLEGGPLCLLNRRGPLWGPRPSSLYSSLLSFSKTAPTRCTLHHAKYNSCHPPLLLSLPSKSSFGAAAAAAATTSNSSSTCMCVCDIRFFASSRQRAREEKWEEEHLASDVQQLLQQVDEAEMQQAKLMGN